MHPFRLLEHIIKSGFRSIHSSIHDSNFENGMRETLRNEQINCKHFVRLRERICLRQKKQKKLLWFGIEWSKCEDEEWSASKSNEIVSIVNFECTKFSGPINRKNEKLRPNKKLYKNITLNHRRTANRKRFCFSDVYRSFILGFLAKKTCSSYVQRWVWKIAAVRLQCARASFFSLSMLLST